MGWLTNRLTGYGTDNKSIAKSFREQRLAPLLSMAAKVFEDNGAVEILDIGGTEAYWGIAPSEFFRDHNVHVSLLNLPMATLPNSSKNFTWISGDAAGDLWTHLDASKYHLIHSNSVIEHVGSWSRMVAFARNIKAFHGGYFVQTPNFWFPIEPHFMTLFFHWLPKPVRVSLVQQIALGNWERARNVSRAVEIVESSDLLSKQMFSALFDDASIHEEKVFFMTKSLLAIRSAS